MDCGVASLWMSKHAVDAKNTCRALRELPRCTVAAHSEQPPNHILSSQVPTVVKHHARGHTSTAKRLHVPIAKCFSGQGKYSRLKAAFHLTLWELLYPMPFVVSLVSLLAYISYLSPREPRERQYGVPMKSFHNHNNGNSKYALMQ